MSKYAKASVSDLNNPKTTLAVSVLHSSHCHYLLSCHCHTIMSLSCHGVTVRPSSCQRQHASQVLYIDHHLNSRSHTSVIHPVSLPAFQRHPQCGLFPGTPQSSVRPGGAAGQDGIPQGSRSRPPRFTPIAGGHSDRTLIEP